CRRARPRCRPRARSPPASGANAGAADRRASVPRSGRAISSGDFSAPAGKMPARQRMKAEMPADTSNIWLPYTQMKTASPPLEVARTEGTRIVLADGRELIDGIASWWTACHGYNHPHIGAAVAKQLAQMPHVMFGGIVHEQALTLAKRLAALLPGDLD